jgi:hypothetical protein
MSVEEFQGSLVTEDGFRNYVWSPTVGHAHPGPVLQTGN